MSLAIYQIAYCSLVSSSRSFPLTFSPDLLEKIFCHSEHFVEKEKSENHLLQGLVTMVDGVEQTSQNPIFFPAWFLLNIALCYYQEAKRFSNWQVQGIFLEDFHRHISAVESISLYWVSDYGLKTQNE